MDELTIGEKTYISSKRAAKITGYAKDYVGQLCREGRVEARLVGRNWYVLESSITEHRFGVAQKEEEAKKVSEDPKMEHISWSNPTYVQEQAVAIPPLMQKDPDIASSRRVVFEMQNAWQEWFSNQAPGTPALIESGSEAFDGSLVPEIREEEEEMEEEIHISRMQSTEEGWESAHVPEEEVSFTARNYTERPPVQVSEVMDLSTRLTAAAASVPVISAEKEARRSSSLVVKTILLGLAFVAVCIALVGTGTIEDLTGVTSSKDSLQGQVLQYLGGESEYKNSK